MRKFKNRSSLVAVLALGGVLATGGVVYAVSPGAGTTPAEVLASGSSVAADARLEAALGGPIISAYKPDSSKAAKIEVAGQNWVVTPAEAGGLCLQITTGAATCATGAEVHAGALAITTLANPPADQAERLAAAIRAAERSGEKALPKSALPDPTEGTRTGIAPQQRRDRERRRA